MKDNLLTLLNNYAMKISNNNSPSTAVLHAQNRLLLLPDIREAGKIMRGMGKEFKWQTDQRNKFLFEIVGHSFARCSYAGELVFSASGQ